MPLLFYLLAFVVLFQQQVVMHWGFFISSVEEESGQALAAVLNLVEYESMAHKYCTPKDMEHTRQQMK